MGTSILDVAIGLVLVYLVLAFVCMSVNEYIAQVLSLRAENLWKAIQTLFQASPQAEAWAKEIYSHHVVCSLSPAIKNAKPSYLPADVFSLALVDKMGLEQPDAGAKKKATIVSLLESAEKAKKVPAEIAATLRPLAIEAGDDLNQFRLNIERWFDKAMERASGWYKRRVQTIIFWVAFSVALVMNADTLMLVDNLWSEPKLRAQFAATGIELASKANSRGDDAPGEVVTEGTPVLSKEDLEIAKQDAMKLLGWSGPINWAHPSYSRSARHRFPAGWEWPYKLLGILITAFAASLGAPFWFDILKRIVNLRSSGSPPGEKADPKGGAPQASNRIGATPDDKPGTSKLEEKK